MTDILVDQRDARFVLFDLLNVQALVEHSRFSQLDRE